MKYSDSSYLSRRKSSGSEHFLRDLREKEVGRLLRSSGGLADGATLLDIGAADGSLVRYLGGKYPGVRLIAADRSVSLLTGCSDHVGYKVIADVRALPLAASSIDVVTAVSTLKHVADLARALQELHRVLKPEGRVIMVEPSLLALRIGMACSHFDPRYTPHRMGSVGYRKLFLDAGFTAIESLSPHRPGSLARRLMLPYLSLAMRSTKHA